MPKTATPRARLPEPMRDSGGQVAVVLPLEDGSVAHRPKWDVLDGRNARGSSVQERVVRPVCRAATARGVKWGAFTAGWADHLGAHACPADECFGKESA